MLLTTNELFFEAEPKTFVNISAIIKVVDQTDYKAVSKTDPGQRDWIAVVTIQGQKDPVRLTGMAARRLFLKCRSMGWVPPELAEVVAPPPLSVPVRRNAPELAAA